MALSSLIVTLIVIAVFVLIVWLVLYLIEEASGHSIPPPAKRIVWVIVLLVCLLYLIVALGLVGAPVVRFR